MRIARSGLRTATATAIGVLAVAISGVGIATAANGGSLMLGQSNAATHTTTLKDANGTPLSLFAKKGKAPLSVNSDGLVKKLNAGELGGLTAGVLSSGSTSQLKLSIIGETSGAPIGVGLPAPSSDPAGTFRYKNVLSTKRLRAGTYQVNAMLTGEEAVCFAATAATHAAAQNYALVIGGSGPGVGGINTQLPVKKGQEIHIFCAGAATGGALGGLLVDGGMNVARVQTATIGKHAPADTAITGLFRKK